MLVASPEMRHYINDYMRNVFETLMASYELYRVRMSAASTAVSRHPEVLARPLLGGRASASRPWPLAYSMSDLG